MTTLLVMTVGRTDVQLVVNEQRHEFDGRSCGTLHDAIKSRSWGLVDALSDKSRGEPLRELPPGDLLLCTPKLDAVLAHFPSSLPTSVLIFETRRRSAGDPRFAGEVLEHRLRDRGVEDITRVAFLTGDERLEDPSNEVDAVVRRSVVATLSNAIALATTSLNPDDLVLVATTGGLQPANELINELVRLRCVGGPRVTALEVPDGDRTKQGDRAVEEKFHPAAGYSARWHALSLIEKGNLLGAWGAVSHLEGSPGQDWTQVIQWLAHFASSLPLPADCDLAVLSHQRMAVRAALRVELALRAGDIPRAIHGTVAFLESALWDHLAPRVERHPSSSRLFRIVQPPLPTTLVRDENADDNSKRPFDLKKTINGVDWYWIHDDRVCCTRLAKRYLALDGLEKLAQASDPVAWDLRNDIAHNEPTPELMNVARTRMQEAGLWSNTNTFLAQPLVENVLLELGVDSPREILNDLLKTVRATLLAVPCADSPVDKPHVSG